jgi:hypothetical protein
MRYSVVAPSAFITFFYALRSIAVGVGVRCITAGDPAGSSHNPVSVDLSGAETKARTCEAGDPNLSSPAENYLARLSEAVLGTSGRA